MCLKVFYVVRVSGGIYRSVPADIKYQKTGAGTYIGEKTAETWPFWVAMDAVLGQRDHVNPPKLFSSSHGPIVREPGPAYHHE
uniref:Uncharacterized protein n=1 Tax=Timema bartmani TaxID=61472 RepID=A0A7R9IA00_9NEOP|nr:unnamed protein product [Timema bartmani]